MECSSPGIYFCGKDEFKIFTQQRDDINPFPVPVQAHCAFVDIVCKTSIELIVYRKSYNSFTWFAKGFGVGCTTEACTAIATTVDFQYPEIEIFPNDLQITKVRESPDGVIGLSEVYNTFYQCRYDFNVESDQFHFTTEEIKVKQYNVIEDEDQDAPSVTAEEYFAKFTHLASDDTDVYIVDETSSIYNVIKNKLVWKLPNGKIIKMVCGFSHNLILTDTGAVYGWGNGKYYSSCVIRSRRIVPNLPIESESITDKMYIVHCHCAPGSRGQLGQDVIILSCPIPQRIEFFDDLPCIVSDIAAGGWHTLTLTSDGDVYTWGWNESNQLGLPSKIIPSVHGIPYPIDLGSYTNPIIAIAAGSRHSVVLMKDGSVYAWGFNKFGQLGLGDTVNRELPVKLELSSLHKQHCMSFACKVVCTRWGTFIFSNNENKTI